MIVMRSFIRWERKRYGMEFVTFQLMDGVVTQQIEMVSILFEMMVRPAILSSVEAIRRQEVRLTSLFFFWEHMRKKCLM